MKIFPAIDIKDKKCVRLIKGDFNNKTEYETSPVDQAGKYKDHGFKNFTILNNINFIPTNVWKFKFSLFVINLQNFSRNPTKAFSFRFFIANICKHLQTNTNSKKGFFIVDRKFV